MKMIYCIVKVDQSDKLGFVGEDAPRGTFAKGIGADANSAKSRSDIRVPRHIRQGRICQLGFAEL
jgi:hypothetical protein